VSRQVRAGLILATLLLVVLAACGGGSGATPTATPSPTAEVTPSPTAEATEAATPSPTPNPDEATLEGPAEVEAGADFEVAWTGPDAQGDYIAIVPASATEWTFSDDYFNTNSGSPGTLKAPTTPGPYELVYFDGATDGPIARAPIEVTPFSGDLLAPEEVAGGTLFDVAWNGPDGAGDYITIMEVEAGNWNGEDYFSTSSGSPGQLVAPIKAGAYEIRYISGTGAVVQAARPITVLELEATIDAPDEVAAGEQFDVEWTGPNGPGDYITIVPEGAEPRTYLSYFGTSVGSPGTLTAPEEPGEYELWYVTATQYGIFARTPITITP
jgi:Ca-activated chloride channel family protein